MKNKLKLVLVAIVFTLGMSLLIAEATEKEEVNAAEETTAETTTIPETTTEEITTVDPSAFKVVAHRGFSGMAPENSMPAFQKAVAYNFQNIELDIRRCKPDTDGSVTWVISHDNSLSNTMGISKNISDLTYKEVLNYSYSKGNNISLYKNLKIVSYPEIIEYIKECKDAGYKINWQIELKYVGSDDNYTDYFADEVVKPIIDAGIEDCVTFSSFHASYIKAIKKADSSIKTWYLSTILDEDAVNYADSGKAEGISFKGNVNTTNKANVQNAINNGFLVGAYNIDSPVLAGAYYSWGIRIFTTNLLTPNELSMSAIQKVYDVKNFNCVASTTSYTYTGGHKTPTMTVTYNGIALVEGINYNVSYTDNKNPGTAKAVISGLNNSTGEQEVSYKIKMPKVTGFKVTKNKTTYIGLSWTANKNVTGYIIYQYNYSKKKYEAIKTISKNTTTTAKIKKLQSAKKYRFRVKTYLKVGSTTHKSTACTGKTTYTRPCKIKLTSVKRSNKYTTLKTTWTAPRACTGYNIKISTDKAMKNVVGYYTVKGFSKRTVTIKGLGKYKNYYVKARAYLKVGSKTYNGVYTSVTKSKGKTKKKK